MLATVVDCNRKLEKIRKEKIEKGEPLGDDEELILIRTDVVGLFPKITAPRTGRIVRYKVQGSSLKFEGMNFKQASLYVRQCFPWRKKVGGTAPGMNNI